MYRYVVRRPYMLLKTHSAVVERRKEGYVGPWQIDTFGELTPTCGGPGDGGGGGYPGLIAYGLIAKRNPPLDEKIAFFRLGVIAEQRGG